MLNTNLKKDQIYFLGFLLLIGSIVFILLINKYENFGFANYDLGIFFNKIANIDQGYYSYIFHGHSNFYLLLFAALLKIFTLKYIIYFSIFFKVLVLFATAILIRYKLNFFLSYLYLLFFPIWFLLMDNYKLDYLIIPLSFFIFYFIRKKNYLPSLFLSILVIFLKEFFSIYIFCFGIFILFSDNKNKKDYFYSLVFIITSFLIFYLLTHHLITTSAWNTNNLNQNEFYKDNIFFFFKSLIKSFFENQNLTFDEILIKIKFYIFPFLSLAFLNLFKKKYLIFFFPIFFVSLVSPDLNHSGYGHHYYATIVSPSIYAIYDLMNKDKFTLIKNNFILIFVFIFHVLISPSPVSKLFWSNKIEKYGFPIYMKKPEYKKLSEFLETIKDDQIIVAQNNLINAKIIMQNKMLVFPQGILESAIVPIYEKNIISKTYKTKNIFADYLILDSSREKFIKDRSCMKIYQKCNNFHISNKYDEIKKGLPKNFKIIYEINNIRVYERLK